MPIQTAWKTMEKAAAAMASQEPFALSETEFPYLDAKPEVGDYKVNKGRRNAGEQLLQKKLAGQAYVLKQVVGQGQRAKLGKKRRARLLSENCDSEEMKLNVPYSMNRKNRWELESAVDCLRDRAADPNVHLSAVDQHFTLKNGLMSTDKDVLAFHELSNEGLVNSRHARSLRGSTLSSLNSASLANGAAEEKSLSIRYVMAKAHPITKYAVAGSVDKVKPLPRSTRRRAQMDVSLYSEADETHEQEEDDDEIGSCLPVNSIAQQSEETLRMYLPRQQTYTLADFISEKRMPTVFVRSPRNRHVPLDTFVQVEMPDTTLASLDDHSTTTSENTSPLLLSPITTPNSKLQPSNSLFKTLHCSTTMSIKSRDDWLRQCKVLAERQDLHFRWLNAAHCSFQVDATSLLMNGSKAVSSPHLVLTLAYEQSSGNVRMLMNGSQHCQVDVASVESSQQVISLDALVELVVKNAKITEPSKPDLQGHASEFNSSQFAIPITPLNDYALFAGQKITSSSSNPNESEKENQVEAEPAEDDDFEHIEMDQLTEDSANDQLLDNKWCDSSLDDQVAQMKTICEECGETNVSKVLLLDQCGHTFCSRCLKAFLHQQICDGTPVLKCAFTKCSAEIQPHLLLSIFELPTATLVLHSCARETAKLNSQHLFSCPSGCGLALVNQQDNQNGHALCTQCKMHFCSHCYAAPHWPMTCHQQAEWSRKRDLQKRKDNEISAQFWSVCSEARKGRMDLTVARTLARDARKRVGYKLEHQFWDTRKTALQLIENGYAWLYMTRNAGAGRPENWSTIKHLLGILHNELNLLEKSLVYGAQGTSTGAQKPDEQLQRVRSTLRKAMQELQNTASNNSQ